MILFIVLLVLLLVTAIFLIVYYPIHYFLERKKFKERIGKKLYKLANKKDFYLLNNLVIKADEETTLHIDHLLCGDKYIYVVADRYYPLAIDGNPEDNSWFSYVKHNKKQTKKNIILINEERTLRLARFLGWTDNKLPILISVVCVNDSVVLNKELAEFKRPFSYFVKAKNVAKVISYIEENTKVNPLSEENLQKLVNSIHDLSLKASKKDDETN